MKRSYRLQRLIDIAGTVERIAARALADSDEEVSRCADQLEQLRRYRSEYEAPAAGRGEAMSAQTLQEYYLFMSRLNDLIATLESRLGELTSTRDQHHEQWFQQYRKNDALAGIQDRERRSEVRRDDARAERETGDQASYKSRAH